MYRMTHLQPFLKSYIRYLIHPFLLKPSTQGLLLINGSLIIDKSKRKTIHDLIHDFIILI